MLKLTTDEIEGKAPEITESLDELAREGARRMILAALELEVEQYVQALRHLRDEQDHALVVRNGSRTRADGSGGSGQHQDPGSSSGRSAARASASAARFCRPICDALRAWRKHCRCCICAVCRPETSRRR